MGIRLVSEVLDRYHGPDARKLWLLAWAEKANDGTRAGWPTREVLAHRTGRSPSRVSHLADELVTEGVIKRDGGGNRSGPARFILLPLGAPEKSAPSPHPSDEEMGAHDPHSQPEVKGASSAHSSELGKSAARAHPKPRVKGAESAGKGAESGRKGADPMPLPAETGSLPLSISSEEQPSQKPSVVADAPTAQTIIASFIDWVRANEGELTRRTAGQLAKQIGDLLEQGMPDRYIRKGLADWYAAGQNPSTLDSFVNAARNAAVRHRASQSGQNGSTSQDRAQQARDAAAVAAAIMEGRVQP